MSQTKIGQVVANKMNKTIVVKVTTSTTHKLYKKRIKKSKKIKAHSENEVNIGDSVKIIETRPYSKSVNFKVLEVVKK